MNTLLSKIVAFLRSPPLLFMVLITAVSFAGRAMPSPWDDAIRRLIGLIVLYFIVWLVFQVRIYRKELLEHRHAIMQMLDRSTRELEIMRRVAADLALKVAEENRHTAKIARDQMSELRAEVVASTKASRSAEHMANDLNTKIEDLKTSETEQLDTIKKTTKDSHKKLETIQATTTQSHEILKERKKL